MSRIVCWFSCGAASAVATKLVIEENARGKQLPLVVARCAIDEEHADSHRFAADCEKWFGVPIVNLKSEKYGSSIYAVFEGERYLAGVAGASCTRALKRRVREAFQQPDDIHVFGFTMEEPHRIDQVIDANADIRLMSPLIDRGLSKSDCLAIIDRAGIPLPVMYGMGYEHANCVGCVKGGAGYWNKIRVDFPAAFERMAEIEARLGVRLVKVKDVRVSLRELPPDVGDAQKEAPIQCGIFCEMAEREIA